ncbi:hypothetical protein EVAR_61611_1, partial [Eumeta japonica]
SIHFKLRVRLLLEETCVHKQIINSSMTLSARAARRETMAPAAAAAARADKRAPNPDRDTNDAIRIQHVTRETNTYLPAYPRN